MKKRLTFILLFLLLVFGFLLRAYNLKNSFSFSGEFGDNFLDIKNAAVQKIIPLSGPPVSHPWLKFGPLYYWLMIPLVIFFDFSVYVGAWFGIVMGTLLILVNYLVIEKIVNKKVALISSTLISISPLLISFSRDARFFFITTLVFYVFLYCLWNFNKTKKGEFFLGLSYSLFFNFHYSPILLFPVLVYFLFLKRKEITIKKYINLFIGLFIPFIPLIIYDFKNKFEMFVKLFLWVPYRFAGFFGLYPKNNISFFTLNQSFKATMEFVGKSFTYRSIYWPYVLVLFLLIYVFVCLKYLRSKKYSFVDSFMYLSLFIAILAIVVHGDVPVHYYLPVFPIPIIIVSMFIDKIIQKNNSVFKGIILVIIVLIFCNNLSFFYKFYKGFNENSFSINTNFVSVNLQEKVAQFIVDDSDNKNYSLIRVGPNDQFEENYSQNYRYLLWLYGNEPIENSSLSYTIYENIDKLPKEIENINYIGPIGIVKNEE